MPANPADLQAALNRLARNMVVTQVALTTKPPAALFALNVEALSSSVENVLALLQRTPGNHPCVVTQAMGPATASLLADALQSEPTPDHIPTDWKE